MVGATSSVTTLVTLGTAVGRALRVICKMKGFSTFVVTELLLT